MRSAAPDYTGTAIDSFKASFGDDEPRHRKVLRGDDTPPPTEAPRRAPPKAKAAQTSSAVIEGVRAFVEDHVPDGHTLEERQMFGMAMRCGSSTATCFSVWACARTSERLLCGHPLETLAQTVSKVRVFGSVRKVIAGEGGNKSVPCSAGLLSASSSLSVWSRSGRPVPSDRLAALEAALRSQWGSPRDRW